MAILTDINRLSTRERSRPRLLQAVTLIVSFTVTAATQAAPGHAEDALVTDPNLTLSAVLSAAVQHHPVQRLLAAQGATGNAEARYGSRLMPESVQLNAFHMSDRSFDDIGANESELAISFPIWMPGEKRAQKAVGDAAAVTRVSREAGFRWQLSGEIRRQLWNIRLARRQWQFAQEQEQRLQEVFEQVARFTEAGELARADLLSTMQQLAAWKAETIAREAEFQDAARSYRSLTSLSAVPEHIEEVLSERDDAGPTHPALSLASDRMAEAYAMAEAVSQTNGYRPTLNVFWRGFRGDRVSTSVDALGIGFSMPLGKSPRKGPEIARAWEAYAQAEAEYLQARRDVDLQLHEARHQLETLQRQLHNSEAMIKTAVEKYDLDRMAFDLGELSTNQWLRRLAEFQEIKRSHQLLQVRYGAAIAAYNQAVGESL